MLKPWQRLGPPWLADPSPLIGEDMVSALSKAIRLKQGCALSFCEAAMIDVFQRYSSSVDALSYSANHSYEYVCHSVHPTEHIPSPNRLYCAITLSETGMLGMIRREPK